MGSNVQYPNLVCGWGIRQEIIRKEPRVTFDCLELLIHFANDRKGTTFLDAVKEEDMRIIYRFGKFHLRYHPNGADIVTIKSEEAEV